MKLCSGRGCANKWKTCDLRCPKSNHQWSKPSEEDEHYIEETTLSRTRKETISGFKNSRQMTTIIESTFGVILSSYTPNNIQSMGGDELIADITSIDQWIEIIEAVERQCSILYSKYIDKKPRLLWWVMILPEDKFDSAFIKYVKELVRKRCEDWGTRFVNPMWSNLISRDSESEN